MGCDIHCYIEYQFPSDVAERYWRDFGGEFSPGRNYEVFGRLAGVRGNGNAVAPRGVPDDIGHRARRDYWRPINHGPAEKCRSDQIQAEHAAQHVESGQSTYKGEVTPLLFVVIRPDELEEKILMNAEHDGKPAYVSEPSAHTPSWLTADEFCVAIGDADDIEYHAMLAAMRTLETSGAKVRVVFWFDN